MRNSNLPPETALAEALDAIAADLQQTLGALRRPPELIEAEARVIEARSARAGLWETYRSASAEQGNSLSRSAESEGRVLTAKAAVATAEVEVNRAQKALVQRREAHCRTIAAAIERHRVASANAIAGAAAILAVAAAAAAAEHVELPEVITYSPAIEGLITAAYRAAAKQRDMADREFSRAAAAMSARAAPPGPAAPMKWKARPSDFGGGIVNDGPVPIAPGSNHTTQRIPAAIVPNGAASPPTAPLRLSASAVGAVARSVLRKR